MAALDRNAIHEYLEGPQAYVGQDRASNYSSKELSNCKAIKNKKGCVTNPNCSYTKSRKCRARKGVKSGNMYLGPMGLPEKKRKSKSKKRARKSKSRSKKSGSKKPKSRSKSSKKRKARKSKSRSKKSGSKKSGSKKPKSRSKRAQKKSAGKKKAAKKSKYGKKH